MLSSDSDADCFTIHPVECSDIARDETARKNMQPLFPDARLTNPCHKQYSVRGTTMKVKNTHLDLKTMLVTPPVPTAKSSPSSLKARLINGKAKVVDENDNLVQVRYSTEKGPVDEIIHKASQPRDPDGTLVIDPAQYAPRVCPRFNYGSINLIPGSGGALIIDRACRVSYIHPTEQREWGHILELSESNENTYKHASLKFWVSWDGFLYFYLQGLLFQVWVDLDFPGAKADLDYPTIGPLCRTQKNTPDKWKLVQNGRFLTNEEVGGYTVADLKTGTTYYAGKALSNEYYQPCIPFKTGDTVGFYTMHSRMTEDLCEAIEKNKKVDLAQLFAKTRAESKPFWDENKDDEVDEGDIGYCLKYLRYSEEYEFYTDDEGKGSDDYSDY